MHQVCNTTRHTTGINTFLPHDVVKRDPTISLGEALTAIGEDAAPLSVFSVFLRERWSAVPADSSFSSECGVAEYVYGDAA